MHGGAAEAAVTRFRGRAHKAAPPACMGPVFPADTRSGGAAVAAGA